MRKYFEAGLLRLAAWIIDRNVQRAGVTSRKDNNWLFEAHFELHEVANRISREYNEI
jgi:hypothetical protein